MIKKFVEILGKRGQPMAIPMLPSNALSASGAAASLTLTPDPEGSVILFGVSGIYSVAGRGTITATDGVLTHKWGLADQGAWVLPHPVQFRTGATVTVTLSALATATADLSTLHNFTSGVGG